ncbi:putative phage tail protein [Vermiculatibacterium agrestimuris]|uniref:putative phage tail protein n=1 Tax=Vermiculatibacterium agrestimuris TaxID=2941519 RepID=UPI00203AACFB|nr:putative phage tail protein [Vermiculatibacterium agrestimuris]
MRLLEYLRPALRKSPEIQAIQEGLQVGIDDLWDAVESARKQLNVETATWGLSIWEEALGISVEAEKAMDFRRSRIRAKLRGQGTTTVEALCNVAASFSNGEVAVTEHPAEYRVEIKFVGALGLPPNLDDLKAAIAEILPAHLAVGYVSTLKIWNDVKDMTWAEAAGQTWEQLRGGTV